MRPPRTAATTSASRRTVQRLVSGVGRSAAVNGPLGPVTRSTFNRADSDMGTPYPLTRPRARQKGAAYMVNDQLTIHKWISCDVTTFAPTMPHGRRRDERSSPLSRSAPDAWHRGSGFAGPQSDNASAALTAALLHSGLMPVLATRSLTIGISAARRAAS